MIKSKALNRLKNPDLDEKKGQLKIMKNKLFITVTTNICQRI